MYVRPVLVDLAGLGLAALALFGAGRVFADPAPANATASPPALLPEERHLRGLRQLTFGGENAEGYFSADGQRLSLQATVPGQDTCDQIYTLDLTPGAALRRVGASNGRATCSYFAPSGDRLLFSSTRAAGPGCPPLPDRSRGYVWPLYPYQIYSARPDGSDVRRLTQGNGYEAETTICRDGTVVFTSDRDGDLELYRMRLDGSGVTRLTFAPGYDGGAFFSEDCRRIVWRAARPRDEAEAAEMKDLLQKRLVRPSRMELWVADADGGNARQVTDFGAASFAPFFFPRAAQPEGQREGPRRIIFSSNRGDARGREFDLWAINEDGTALERITHAPDFDGFPMFSPDGKRLVFASNRGGKVRGETNLFLADWVPGAPAPGPTTAADVAAARVAWLAAPAREGRGIGSAGLLAASEQIAAWMKEAGLGPGVASGKRGARGFFQDVPVVIGVRDTGSRFKLEVAGKAVDAKALAAAPLSSSGRFGGPLRFVGYGISAPEHGWDDLKGLPPLRGSVAVVLRGAPTGKLGAGAERSYSDLRYKAWNLREHGAAAVVFVSSTDDAPPPLKLDGPEGEAGLPVLFAGRAFLSGVPGVPAGDGPEAIEQLKTLAVAGRSAEVALAGVLSGEVKLSREVRTARNVVGFLPGSGAEPRPAVVLGAHYDHLGLGGRGSFVPDQRLVHPGADDNASGVAAMLAAAAGLTKGGAQPLPFDVYFAAFTGEEVGLVGSSQFVARMGRELASPLGVPPRPDAKPDAKPDAEAKAAPRPLAMINFDMVGRLRGAAGATQPALVVQGTDTAREWPALVTAQCRRAGLSCKLGGDGYGPSDMTPFYAAGVPVLFFFTGAHEDYHRPSDTADRINPAGVAQIGSLAAEVVQRLAAQPALTFQRPQGPAPRRGDGEGRSYGAYLGTIPDYSAMQGLNQDGGGVKLSGARPGSPAEQAGVQAGDILVGIKTPDADRRIASLEDMVFVLRSLKPGQAIELRLRRAGREVTAKAVVGQRPAEGR